MLAVHFPPPAFRIRKEKDKEYIFDNLRKKWVILTPEEWVRQNFICFLVQGLSYPSSLIAVEKELLLGELRKRFDILVFDRTHQPWMLIECKAPEISLNDAVLQQVLRYNLAVPARYLVITNGSFTTGWERAAGRLETMHHWPLVP